MIFVPEIVTEDQVNSVKEKISENGTYILASFVTNNSASEKFDGMMNVC